MLKRAIKRYTAPTSLKLQVWGDVILGIGTTLQVVLQTHHVHIGWTIGVALLTAIGAALPKFAKLYSVESLQATDTTEAGEVTEQTPI